MVPPMEQYTLTPAGEGALALLKSLPFVAVVIFGFLLLVLTVLMPYYIYRTASELRKLRAIAERWEQWMRRNR